jgi:mycofactocin precursor
VADQLAADRTDEIGARDASGPGNASGPGDACGAGDASGPGDGEPAPALGPELVTGELLIEEVSIDGMCGVY